MDRYEAVKLARSWISIRREVRKELIALARERHPDPTVSKEIFRLWNFPTDLTEARLLELIGNFDQT